MVPWFKLIPPSGHLLYAACDAVAVQFAKSLERFRTIKSTVPCRTSLFADIADLHAGRFAYVERQHENRLTHVGCQHIPGGRIPHKR